MASKTEISAQPQDEHWMATALELAQTARDLREVPVGAIVVQDQSLIGSGHNCQILHHDASAHAEIRAIREACFAANNYRLANATLYVTLEPCTMCVGAIIHSRISRVVFATPEPRAGAIISAAAVDMTALNHSFQYTQGILQEQASSLLREFFRARRASV